MDFNEAEKRFKELTRQYQEQKITQEEYRGQIGELRLTDGQGRLWSMQESSGQWHVYQDGSWQPAQPPNELSASPEQPPTKKRSSKLFVFAGVAGVGAIALCIGVLVLASLLRNNELFPKPLSDMDDKQDVTLPAPAITTLLVPADGSPYTDEHGVGLVVPAGALEDSGERVQLMTHELQDDVYRDLEETFNFETPVYQVTVDGEMDGIGNAELHFPFEGDEAVLMVIIDDLYYSFLPIQPENGVVQVGAHLSPSIVNESQWQGNSDAPTQNNIRYALLSQKQAQARDSGNDAVSALPVASGGGRSLMLNKAASKFTLQQSDPQDCSSTSFNRVTIIVSNCRTNKEKSLIVNWTSREDLFKDEKYSVKFTQAEAERLIQEAEKLVGKFQAAGFEGAKLESRWFGNSLKIVVTPGGDPQYNLKNGVIYLPVDSAKALSADDPSLDLVHELAHWVQHKKYSLLRAVFSSARTWWIETSAELMVFMLAPKGVDFNMQLYGRQSGFQKGPFQWDETLYIHAQLLWVSMCDNASACPLSLSSFKQAINTGSYPFLDSNAQEKLVKNLDDYALYLLDSRPRQSNTSAVKNVSMGGQINTGVGEMINIGITTRSNFNITTWGDDSQMRTTAGAGSLTGMASVDARIEKGGVYPLTVASGAAWGQRTPLPAVLVIKPGPPFWLKVGDEEPVRYDGASEYTIQPISDKLGHPIVRVIALGTGDNNRFQATVSLIDLQGDWVLSDSKLSSFINSCENVDPDGENLVAFVETLSYHFASRGTYTAGMVDGEAGFVYEASPGFSLVEKRGLRSPGDDGGKIDYMVTQSGDISIDPEAIEWKMEFNMRLAEGQSSIPEAQLSGLSAGGYGLFLGIIFLVLASTFWLSINGKSPYRRLLGLALVLAAASLACIFTSMDMTTRAKLDRIEYLAPIDNPPEFSASEQPIFRLTGEPVTTVLDITFVIPELSEEIDLFGPEPIIVESAEEVNCRIEIVTESTVEVYPDGIISGVDIFDETSQP